LHSGAAAEGTDSVVLGYAGGDSLDKGVFGVRSLSNEKMTFGLQFKQLMRALTDNEEKAEEAISLKSGIAFLGLPIGELAMPRAIRCNLPGHPYECSTRTVHEQFLLNPFAAPGRFAPEHDHDRLGDRKRLKRDAQIAMRNARELKKLIAQLKAWRSDQGPEPVVTADTLPETVNNIIGTWLAKAIEHTGSQYYGFTVISDHPHHLISHPEGKLDEFFQYFDAQVARALNRFHGRRHQVWSRRYSAIPVLDEQADIERLIYFLTNPQKANLVDTIGDWPGLSSAQLYLEELRVRSLSNEKMIF
jgi:hypothetical protein